MEGIQETVNQPKEPSEDPLSQKCLLLEKELQNAQAIIKKSKEIRILQITLDECQRLRGEIDLLNDQKFQNDALKESIHSIISNSDIEKTRMRKLIDCLRDQLTASGQTPNELGESDKIEPLLDISDIQSSRAVAEAKLAGLEKSAAEWKTEKIKMQKVIGNLKGDVEELKIKLEESKLGDLGSLNAVNQSALKPSASTTTSSWFKFNGASTNPAAANPAAASTDSLQAPVINEQVIAPTPPAASPVSSQPPVTSPLPTQQSTAAPAAAKPVSSWWSRVASAPTTAPTTAQTATAPTTGPTAAATANAQQLAPSTITSMSSSTNTLQDTEKIKSLELEIQQLKKELSDSKLPTLPNELENLKIKLEEQVSQNRTSLERVKELEHHLADSKSSAEIVSGQLEQLQTSLNANLKEIILGEEKIKLLTSEIERLKTEIASKDQNISTLQQKLSNQDTILAESSKSSSIISNLEAQIKDLSKANQQASELSEKVLKQDLTITGLNNNVSKIQEEKMLLLSNIQKLEFDLENNRKAIEHHAATYKVKNDQFEEALKELKSKDEQLINANTELKVVKAQLDSLQPADSPAHTGIDALQQDFKNQLNEIQLKNSENVLKAQEKISALTNQVETLIAQQGQLESAKFALEMTKNDVEHKLGQLSKDSSEKSNELESVYRKLSTLEANLSQKENECKSQLEQGKQLETVTESRKIEIDQLQGRITVLNAEIVSLQGNLNNSAKTIDSMAKTAAESTVTHSNELKSLKDQLLAYIAQIEDFKKGAGDLEKVKQDQQKAIAEIQGKQSSEIQEKLKEIESLKSQIVKQKSELDAAQSQLAASAQQAKRITELTAEVEKKTNELGIQSKKAESHKSEVESLQKQIVKNKEASDHHAKTLQDQLNQIIDTHAASDKKTRLDLEEKYKKDRSEVETLFKREKGEIEEKAKKTLAEAESKNTKEKNEINTKFNAEKLKLTQDLEKLKKEHEQLKNESCKKDDLNKAQARLKQLETDLANSKSEQTKNMEGLNAKLVEASKVAESSKAELAKITESLSVLQAKHDLVLQENEVAQANYARNLKGVTEKEEALKKLKAVKDDLASSERTLKGSVARLEKEKELLASTNESLKQDLEAKGKMVAEAKLNAEAEIQKNSSRLKELEQELQGLRQEKDALSKQLETIETENSAQARKTNQMIKDLQKQLAKQRKGDDDGSIRAQLSIPLIKDQLHSSTIIKGSDEVSVLVQENEALIKRASMFEDELRSADEHLKRVRQELDQKSKVIQQYVLRDHEAALQPDEKPKTNKIGINILSSGQAMQKLDPVILSSINMKMQKLLEDLTVKMMSMEEELKKLKKSR